MADSNITKRALASSLKNLMSEHTFSKISVGDICELCGMNRKSFYYHFRDKYDLVNWIFDREFVSQSKHKTYLSSSEAFTDLCSYVYENKSFYRQAFMIDGQNSFSEFFVQYCTCCFAKEFHVDNENNSVKMLHIKLSAVMLKNAIQHWLNQREEISSQEFCASFALCLKSMYAIIDSKP